MLVRAARIAWLAACPPLHRQRKFGPAFDDPGLEAIAPLPGGFPFRGASWRRLALTPFPQALTRFLLILTFRRLAAFLKMPADMRGGGTWTSSRPKPRCDAFTPGPCFLSWLFFFALFFTPPRSLVQSRNGKIKPLLDHAGLHQFLVRPAERVVAGHLLQTDVIAPVRAILPQRHHAAITFLLRLAEHQTGEELRTGEILATELAGVLLENGRRQRIGGIEHLPW